MLYKSRDQNDVYFVYEELIFEFIQPKTRPKINFRSRDYRFIPNKN
jgi:hypothetical protein